MKNNQLKQMMNGAFLLSIASFIAKILSAIYRVPFQNMVGDTGFYVYQQVYPIYGIGMTFALSGLPVFFSKKIAEEPAHKHQKMIRDSLIILSVCSLLIFLSLYFFANQIAILMGDEALTPIVRSVSWMFLFSPVLATFRGFFQGTYRMKPTAISQVSEQLVRVIVIILAAFLFTKNTETSLYQMGAHAMSGAVWGAIVSTVILIWWMLKETRMESFPSEKSHFSALLKGYLTEGVTICLLTSILVLFQLVDSFTLYKQLVESGITETVAKSLKGIYDRGQPLVQLGLVVGTGFSASFIPLMSQAFVAQRMDEFHRAAQSLIRITACISVAAVMGLLAILPEVNLMLFGDTAGTGVLAIYILSIAVASVMIAYHSILQSFQQYRSTLLALGFGIVVKLLLNQLLIARMGTAGASLATVIGLVVMVFVMAKQLPFAMRGVWRKDSFTSKLTVGGLLLFIVAFSFKWLLRMGMTDPLSRSQAMLVALVTVVIGVVVFLIYALRVKLFTIREWVSLPFGKKLLRFGRK